jgi:hypothetical protein
MVNFDSFRFGNSAPVFQAQAVMAKKNRAYHANQAV